MPIYDVENRFSYYKNYSDNILVGPSVPTMGSSVWQRFVSGSVVSGSEEYKAATLLSDFRFKLTNPFYKSGEVRYLRLLSGTQTLQDSVPPNILELCLTGTIDNSGSIIGSGVEGDGSLFIPLNFGGIFTKLYFALDGNAVTSSTSNRRVNNTNWSYSFPFEKKYFEVKKFADLNKPFLVSFSDILQYSPPDGGYHIIDNAIDYNLSNQTIVIGLTLSGSTLGFGGTEGALIDLYFDSTGSYNGSAFTLGIGKVGSFNNPILAPKLIFGINPQPLGRTKAPYEDVNGDYRFTGSYCTGSIIEGWRYGLYNGVPTNFSCVFRQNHYGQPRDMLEGRPYTKTYNNPKIGGPLDTDGGINFISGSALAGESNNWLTASIYNGTNVSAAYTVNPFGSGIFDKEYRASQPWHDDDSRLGT